MEVRRERSSDRESREAAPHPHVRPAPPPLDAINVWSTWGNTTFAGRNSTNTVESTATTRRTYSSFGSGSAIFHGSLWRGATGQTSLYSWSPSTWWSRILSLPGKIFSFFAWFTALMCFVIANFMLPIICGFQMLLLDYVLCREGTQLLHWVWLFVVCEMGLLAHLVRHRAQMNIVGSGSFQWIVYSWLISTKSCILYFHVLPDYRQDATLDLRSVVTLLWTTPVFYTILTFRTLRELFQSDGMKQDKHGHHGRKSQVVRDKQEHSTLDVVLLTDMVWHVVIDMIDIFYMMFFSDPFDPTYSIVDPLLLAERPDTVRVIRVVVGAFIFLGLFFHQQSFPSIGYMAASSRPMVETRESSKRSSSGSRRGGRSLGSGGSSLHRSSINSNEVSSPGLSKRTDQGGHAQSGLDYRVDVVKARKRSAIVSILMVDLPFLVIRTYMYLLSMNTEAANPTTITSTTTTMTNTTIAAQRSPLFGRMPFSALIGQRQLDKFWVKNILCLLLQAMQLRFVQQADLERSQSLRWWDLRRTSADGPSLARRGRRGEQDRLLRKKWQELDRGKLEAAMFDTGVSEQVSPTQSIVENNANTESVPQVSTLARGLTAAGLGLGGEDHKDSTATTGTTQRTSSATSSARRGCCARFCRRYACRRCCSCDCSSGILAHTLMGAILGWFIAKVDFHQAATDLMLGIGRQAGEGAPQPM